MQSGRLYNKILENKADQPTSLKRYQSLQQSIEALHKDYEINMSSGTELSCLAKESDRAALLKGFIKGLTIFNDTELPEICSTERPTTFTKENGTLLLKFQADLTQLPLNISVLPHKKVIMLVNFKDELPVEGNYDLRLEGNRFKLQPKFLEQMTMTKKIELLINNLGQKRPEKTGKEEAIVSKLFDDSLLPVTPKSRIIFKPQAKSTRNLKPIKIEQLDLDFSQGNMASKDAMKSASNQPLTARQRKTLSFQTNHQNCILSNSESPLFQPKSTRHAFNKMPTTTEQNNRKPNTLVVKRSLTKITALPDFTIPNPVKLEPIKPRSPGLFPTLADQSKQGLNDLQQDCAVPLLLTDGKVTIVIRLFFAGEIIVVAPTWSSSFTKSQQNLKEIKGDNPRYLKFLRE